MLGWGWGKRAKSTIEVRGGKAGTGQAPSLHCVDERPDQPV